MSEENNTPVEEVSSMKDVTISQDQNSMSLTANMADPEVDPMDNQPIEMPEQFANTDNPQQALLKSYNELRAKMSKGEAPEAEPTAETPATDAEPEATPDAEPEVKTEGAEANWTAKYHEQGGSLTDDQLMEASKQTGETVESIKEYIEFKKGKTDADIANSDQQVLDAIGGVEEYTKISKWANESLPEADLSAVESMLSNPELAKQGANVLKALYNNQASIEPKSLVEGGNGGEAPDVYMSNAEEVEDIQNPLYKTSPKFRRTVAEKMQRSMAFHRRKK